MRLALYEPDIPQNAGSLMRLGACLGRGIDVIEPCGFLLSDRSVRRAGMDYLKIADIQRHASWARFPVTVSVTEELGTEIHAIFAIDAPPVEHASIASATAGDSDEDETAVSE